MSQTNPVEPSLTPQTVQGTRKTPVEFFVLFGLIAAAQFAALLVYLFLPFVGLRFDVTL